MNIAVIKAFMTFTPVPGLGIDENLLNDLEYLHNYSQMYYYFIHFNIYQNKDLM